MIKIVFAILSLAASASALTCYTGYTSDAGTTPANTVTGCTMCTKTIQRYKTSYGEAFYGVYSGYLCAATSFTNVGTGFLSTVASVSATCSADFYIPINTLSNAANTVVNNVVTPSCVATSSASSCASSSDSGSSGYCTCCSDNCNSAGLKCGASAIASFSMLSMILFAIVGYFMRQ